MPLLGRGYAKKSSTTIIRTNEWSGEDVMDPVLAFHLLKYGLRGIGVLFLVIGARLLLRQYLRFARSISVDGRTIDVRSEGRWVNRGTSSQTRKTYNTVYMAVLEFTARDGSKHRCTDPVARTDKPELGSVLSVRYDPNSPDDAFVSTFASAWMGPLVFVGLGCLVLLLSLLVP
jgi:hypothetical protein